MGYTLSFEASVKVQRGRVVGLLRHNGRDVDREQGREVQHANWDIDAARTPDNETLVADGSGGFRLCADLREIRAALDRRLADVKKPLRKDAVVLRPLVLQLDPEWYAVHQDEDERVQAAEDMFEWARNTFGSENLLYAALHNDERSPHLHIGFCPVTDDGRLSQKDWFPDPKSLRKMHKDFREYMTGKGYEIEMENRKPGKYAKRMSEREYKDFRELEKEREWVETQKAELEARSKAQDEREAALNERERAVEALEEAVEAYKQEVKAWARESGDRVVRAVNEAEELVDDVREQLRREEISRRISDTRARFGLDRQPQRSDSDGLSGPGA